MTFDSSMNQPPWLPHCLREIESRSAFLTNWEWGFIGKIRPKIENSSPLTDWEQEKLFQVHKQVMRRKQKPPEKEYKPKPQIKSWVD